MRSKAKILNLSIDNKLRVKPLVFGAGVVLLLVMFVVASSAAVSGDRLNTAEPDPIRVVESEKTEDAERVTLAIPVEVGAEIDLESSKNVRVDSWDGDEVLVIVERVVKPGNTRLNPEAEPMDIRITRQGKHISIHAMNEFGVPGVDVVFRVVVPRSLNATPSSIKSPTI